MKTDLHGLLLIDKPSGITSHDVVAKVRRVLNSTEVGHTGTLDPLASGLMVILLGEATKLSQFILEKDKSYEVGFKLGETTDTLDCTGQILKQVEVNCIEADVLKTADQLKGKVELAVPSFSAVKVDGKKLYEYARSGEEVPKIPRVMEFKQVLYLGKGPSEHEYKYFLHCSKGTFVRAWVSELGDRLGCGAVMVSLRRVETPPFSIKGALTLEELSDNAAKIRESSAFLGLDRVLEDSPLLRVTNMSESLLKNGQISHDLRRRLISVFDPEKHQVARVFGTDDQRLLAIVGLEKSKGFVIRRVFKY